MDEVTLLAGGMEHAGWMSVRIERGLEQQAGSFELELSRLPEDAGRRPNIRPGTPCEVLLGEDPVIAGYVDVVEPSYDAESHRIRVQGRDKTADLIDCSAVLGHGDNETRKQTIDKIARRLAEPYGIEVVAEVDVGDPIPRFDIMAGDTVMTVLQQAAAYAGVLMVSDAHGRLVITHAGAARTGSVLEWGVNILEASATHSLQERFSEYEVRAKDHNNSGGWGQGNARVEATAEDPAVPRYRYLLQEVDSSTQARLERRIQWERNHRAGGAESARVTVQGWRTEAGELWRPNSRVTLRDDWLGFPDTPMVVATAAYQRDDSGTRTELTLKRPGALEPKPAPPIPDDNGDSGDGWGGD